MGIEVIKNLQDEIIAMKANFEAEKTENEKKLEDLQKEFASKLETRKTSFEETKVDSKAVDKAVQKGVDLHLKSILTGRDVTSFAEYKDVAGIIEKAIVPSDVSAWLAEEFSSQMVEKLEAELMVEPIFGKITMPANRSEFSIPGRATDATAYLIAAGQDAISSAITAGKVTFRTNRFKTLVAVADQADNESIVAIIDLVKQELVTSLARASEKAIIAGDTTTADANDVRKAFDGILKMAVGAGNTVDGTGAISAANILAARKKLGVYGLNLSDVAIIAPVKIAYDMLGIDEVTTVDKYGANATILTGEIGKIYGMPIIASAYVPETLTAAGVEGGALTTALVINKRFFAVADRGTVGIEQDRNITASTNIFVGYRDMDFKKLSLVATPVVAIVNL